jgi:hypothetical protein
MSDRVVPSPYRAQYNAAVKLFDDGHVDASVALAKFNVAQAKAKLAGTITDCSRDLTVPPYFSINNAALIASGLDDWEYADDWRLAAGQKHATCLKYLFFQSAFAAPRVGGGQNATDRAGLLWRG